MVTFIGMLVVAGIVTVGVYTLVTRITIRDYTYKRDEDGNETVVDEND